jgi:hypothetical protein
MRELDARTKGKPFRPLAVQAQPLYEADSLERYDGSAGLALYLWGQLEAVLGYEVELSTAPEVLRDEARSALRHIAELMAEEKRDKTMFARRAKNDPEWARRTAEFVKTLGA